MDSVSYENKIEIKKTSLTIGEDFTLNYFVDMPAKYVGSEMRFTIGSKDPVLVSGVLDGGRYRYSFDGICPQNMRDTVTAELIYGGDPVFEAREYTVYEYLTTLLTKTAVQLGLTDSAYSALQTLVADTLYYGAAAQTYTGYNTGNLATEGVLVSPTSFTGPGGTVKNLVKNNTVEGVAFTAA